MVEKGVIMDHLYKNKYINIGYSDLLPLSV